MALKTDLWCNTCQGELLCSALAETIHCQCYVATFTDVEAEDVPEDLWSISAVVDWFRDYQKGEL